MPTGHQQTHPNTRCNTPTHHPPPRLGIRALVIADRPFHHYGHTIADVVANNAIDLVITAGDLHPTDIPGIDTLDVPTLGVYGNHCDGHYLDDLGITNLYLTQVTIAGTTFTGLQGCVRYKTRGHGILYTQTEYTDLITHLPAADVLITHCPPAGINDHPTDLAHTGITALRHWLHTHQPHTLIHGHTYPKNPTTTHGPTHIEYVHGTRIINL